MIDPKALRHDIEQWLEGTPLFLVNVTVTPDNDVTVTIDSPVGVDLEQCQWLSDLIHQAYDADKDDYSLEVGSAGLTAPFEVPEQYVKNVGLPVEARTSDGRIVRGRLTEVDVKEGTFTVTTEVKVKEPGQKRPVLRHEPVLLPMQGTRTVYDIDRDL